MTAWMSRKFNYLFSFLRSAFFFGYFVRLIALNLSHNFPSFLMLLRFILTHQNHCKCVCVRVCLQCDRKYLLSAFLRCSHFSFFGRFQNRDVDKVRLNEIKMRFFFWFLSAMKPKQTRKKKKVSEIMRSEKTIHFIVHSSSKFVYNIWLCKTWPTKQNYIVNLNISQPSSLLLLLLFIRLFAF